MPENITYYASSRKPEVTHCGMVWNCVPRNNDAMKLALGKIRNGKGLTQRVIAERLGVSDAQISRWESGKDNIPSHRLPDIAQAYECSIGEMFGEPPHEAPATPVSDAIPAEIVESVLQWVYRRLDLPEQEANLLARASVVVMQQTAESGASPSSPEVVKARVETAIGVLHSTTRQ